MPKVKIIDRAALIETRVTLDGKPACIAGRLNPFATVATLDGKARFEFTWETVARIVDKGGKFKS